MIPRFWLKLYKAVILLPLVVVELVVLRQLVVDQLRIMLN
jgi:hypothetical protein